MFIFRDNGFKELIKVQWGLKGETLNQEDWYSCKKLNFESENVKKYYVAGKGGYFIWYSIIN